MLEPTWITLITIVGGSLAAVGAYLLTVRRSGNWMVPLELWTGYLINSLTLATLACFIFNICWVVVTAALTGADVGAIKINGNEALIFWIFVYSFGQAALSLRRAVLAVAPKA